MSKKQDLKYVSQVHKAERQISVYMEDKCADVGAGLAPVECHLMAFLDKYPSRPSTLERVFGLKQSTVTSMIDRMVKKGLIKRAQDLNDRRAYILTTTKKASALVDEMSVEVDRFEKQITKQITKNDYKGFLAVLEAIEEVTNVKLRE